MLACANSLVWAAPFAPLRDVNELIPMSSWLLKLARSYVRVTSPIGFIAKQFLARLGSSLPADSCDPHDALCIDVGAGTAPYRSNIEKHLGVSHYLAFDIAPTNVTDVVGNATRMPFPDGCARWVTSFDVIQHIPDCAAVFAEIERVLAPGGHLILTFPFNYCECDAEDYRRWTLAGMDFELRRIGFQIVQLEQRGGRFFSFACALNWVMQHALPGQRRGWRAKKSLTGFVRAGFMIVITTPTTILQWLMLGLDRLLPNTGCYMGGIVVARKSDRGELRVTG